MSTCNKSHFVIFVWGVVAGVFLMFMAIRILLALGINPV